MGKQVPKITNKTSVSKFNKKLINYIFGAITMLSILFINTVVKADEDLIISTFYDIDYDEGIIYRIEPETTIETFKAKFSSTEFSKAEDYYGLQEFQNNLKIYKDKECTEEITEGFIGTGMYLENEDKVYELSVVGDLNGDGKATQVELTNIIRYIVGLNGANLDGIKYNSADITGDGTVDQRDITKLIRYIVYGELDLGKIDTTPPDLQLETQKQLSNEMTVKLKVLDKEGGMPENPTYVYYYKKSSEPENRYVKFYEGPNTEVELTNLDQNTWYDIKATTKDKAGNECTTSMDALTPKIPDGTEDGAILFGNVTWKNGMAKLDTRTTIKREDFVDGDMELNETYRVEYQVNGTNGLWQKGDEINYATVTGLKHGDVVYARLTDGRNSGSFIYKNIIDDMEPSININAVTDDTNLSATVTVVLAEDDESGMAEHPIYTYYIKEEGADDSTYVQKCKDKNDIFTFTNLKPNTKYRIRVEIQDIAGNIGASEEVIEIKGEKVPDATETGAIIFENLTWKNGQAEVTIKTKTGFQIEYQINGTTGTWSKGPSGNDAGTSILVKGINNNDTIYARLTDGTTAGSYTTLTVIDNIIPNLEVITTVKSTTEMKAEAIATDDETGIDSTATYAFYIKKENEDDSKYVLVQNTTDKTCNFTGLIAGEKYSVKVEVQDRAGNKATKIVTETMDNLPDGTSAGSILFSGLTWNSGTAEVTISTNTEYTIEYQINSINGSWTKGSAPKVDVNVTGLKHGDIIYARLTDGTSSGSYATLIVADTIKPNIELNLEAKNETITATANAEDLESGLATDVKYKFYMKETGADDSTYIEKQNTISNILTVPGLTIGKNYTIKVEVEDKAGNKGMIEKSILIPDDIAPVVDFTVLEKTSNSAKVKATATDVGGLPTPTIYIFYIKETGADDSTYREIQNSSSDTCEFTGLEQKKDYTIKVTVADEAGNIGMKERSVLTDGIPDATEAGAINFESLIWRQTSGIGKAEVVISTKTKYFIEYQVNSTTGTWTRGTTAGGNVTITGLNHNDIIYARLTDGTSSSNYATLTVVDAKAPILGMTTTSTTSEIETIVTAVDNETGMGTSPTYKFSIKANSTSGTTSAVGTTYTEMYNGTNATYKFTGLTAGETYTVKIETQDLAGNISTKEQTITTKSIPVASGAIKFGAVIWNKGLANVSISTTETSFYIEYQVNSTSGTWIRAATAGATIKVENLNHNDVIYARLTDGTNAGIYATLTIIDNIAPEDFMVSVTNMTPVGFKIVGGTIDNQSGIKDYTYVIEKGGVVTSAITNEEETVTEIAKGNNVEEQQSNNINRVSYNDNNTSNTSRSFNKNINRSRWTNRKGSESQNRAIKSTSKRKY